MALVGYARVSSVGQSLDVQLDLLKTAGCEKVYAEKKSGLDGKRQELAKCLDFVRDGDVLAVTKLDRLARSTVDLYAILGKLKDKGVDFRCLDNRELDTTTKHGKLLVGILALIADFESDIRKERQLEGIAKAKDKGVKFGRVPKLTAEEVARIRSERRSGDAVATLTRRYGISRATLYRALGDAQTDVAA